MLRWSERKFGQAADERYLDLLIQALRDLSENPERPGSKEQPGLLVRGARTYHLYFSRYNVSTRPVVKVPRHFILYRLGLNGGLEVGRILHDSQDLPRHLPEGYGFADDPE